MLSQSGELTPRHCKAVAAWIGFVLGILEIDTDIGGSLGILRVFEISGALSAKRGKLWHEQHVKHPIQGESRDSKGANPARVYKGHFHTFHVFLLMYSSSLQRSELSQLTAWPYSRAIRSNAGRDAQKPDIVINLIAVSAILVMARVQKYSKMIATIFIK
ncbi:MAG TPA: hypothetical protein PLB25_12190 [Rhodoferax sp.]|nr:hypothetical protein [Rhodoferax sp.]